MKNLSLRLRLILSFILVSLGVWATAGVLSWHESREQLDEFFDTYQLLLARQLATADWKSLNADTQKKADQILEDLEEEGEEEDEALGFAIFDHQGKMVFNDNEKGADFTFNPQADGFVNQPVGHKGKLWRIVWLKSTDGNFIIAVGQELEYRNEAALEMIEESLLPWLIGLSALLIIMIWMVSRELSPLKKIAKDLAKRSPNDLSRLEATNPPQEIRPLLYAINQLFIRIENMLRRERSFISDSAHELRSPLTALKVQLEVAQLAEDDAKVRSEALEKLNLGIERATRLVEQLLALSRLEASPQLDKNEEELLDWKEIIQNAVQEQQNAAQEKNIQIDFAANGAGPATSGRSLLWSLLLRNLLDNALKYSPDNAQIKIRLEASQLSVTNTNTVVDEKYLSRLGERFFRPPGQKASGSGLGLSIVTRIAGLHSCQAEFKNSKNGFVVTIRSKKD